MHAGMHAQECFMHARRCILGRRGRLTARRDGGTRAKRGTAAPAILRTGHSVAGMA